MYLTVKSVLDGEVYCKLYSLYIVPMPLSFMLGDKLNVMECGRWYVNLRSAQPVN